MTAAFVLDVLMPYSVLAPVMVSLVVFTHRANIGRTLRRSERAM